MPLPHRETAKHRGSSQWSQPDGNSSRTRAVPEDIAPPLKTVWRTRLTNLKHGDTVSRLVADTDRLYAVPCEGFLAAIRRQDGRRLWVRRTSAKAQDYSAYLYDQIAADNGALYFSPGEHSLTFLTAASGRSRWSLRGWSLRDEETRHSVGPLLIDGPTAFATLLPPQGIVLRRTVAVYRRRHFQTPAPATTGAVIAGGSGGSPRDSMAAVTIRLDIGVPGQQVLIDLDSLGDSGAFDSFEPFRIGRAADRGLFLQDAHLLLTLNSSLDRVVGVRYLDGIAGPAAASATFVFHQQASDGIDTVSATDWQGHLVWQTRLRGGRPDAVGSSPVTTAVNDRFVSLALANRCVFAVHGSLLFCLSQDSGRIRWRATMPTSGGKVIYPGMPGAGATQMLVTGGIVYLVIEQQDGMRSRLLAYQVRSGRRLWTGRISGNINDAIADRGAIYLLTEEWAGPRQYQFFLVKLCPSLPKRMVFLRCENQEYTPLRWLAKAKKAFPPPSKAKA